MYAVASPIKRQHSEVFLALLASDFPDASSIINQAVAKVTAARVAIIQANADVLNAILCPLFDH